MSDEENRAGQQEEEQVKSEDPNAPINIKVRFLAFQSSSWIGGG